MKTGGNTQSGSSRLGFSIKLAYALPALALAVVGIPVYVYIPKFYTDTVGVDMALTGLLLMAVRIFDAVTDPLIGHVSDRTSSRFGRRRPYMILGALGLTLAMLFLFNPPLSLPVPPAIWFGFWMFALFLFWTLATVPYEALGPEITFDYHERTELFSWRDGFLIAGTLLAAASPALAAWMMGAAGQAVTERGKFFAISIVYVPLILAAVWICIHLIRERPNASGIQTPFLEGLGAVTRNRPFMILLGAYTISSLGSNLPATLILYYVQYVLQADNAEAFLMLYFVTGIFFLPFWIGLSRHLGKKNAWLLSMAVNTGAFTGVFFLGPGDAWLYGILVFVSGIGFGASLALPSAIQADVIDYDEMLSGERREGRYIGLWSIAKKLAAAMGVGLGLSLLGYAGYVPNADQGPEVIAMLRLLYALVPCICNLLAMAVVWYYPITEARHREIMRSILLNRELKSHS
ncbi:MAG: MFS transporter [Thermodesulfobacteriota bacterium]